MLTAYNLSVENREDTSPPGRHNRGIYDWRLWRDNSANPSLLDELLALLPNL
jgi:hypothetical protein